MSPAAGLLANIDRLYDLAKSYGKGDPNRLVTDYYRQERYAGREWNTLIARAGLEARSQAQMKSNHARLFADGSA